MSEYNSMISDEISNLDEELKELYKFYSVPTNMSINEIKASRLRLIKTINKQKSPYYVDENIQLEHNIEGLEFFDMFFDNYAQIIKKYKKHEKKIQSQLKKQLNKKQAKKLKLKKQMLELTRDMPEYEEINRKIMAELNEIKLKREENKKKKIKKHWLTITEPFKNLHEKLKNLFIGIYLNMNH